MDDWKREMSPTTVVVIIITVVVIGAFIGWLGLQPPDGPEPSAEGEDRIQQDGKAARDAVIAPTQPAAGHQ